jgi:hypothetical protein
VQRLHSSHTRETVRSFGQVVQSHGCVDCKTLFRRTQSEQNLRIHIVSARLLPFEAFFLSRKFPEMEINKAVVASPSLFVEGICGLPGESAATSRSVSGNV